MKNKGFTLVELAIVIVIIGLLVGGVLAGQELIAQAKVRSDIKRIMQIKAVSATFYSKYNAVPGDFNKANLMLGTTGANGNGDGQIQMDESQFFWYHLNAAKITSFLDAGSGAVVQSPTLRVNFREGSSSGWNAPFMIAYRGDLYHLEWPSSSIGVPMNGNSINIATRYGSQNICAAFSPHHVRQVDEKIDDGNARMGNFKATDSLDQDAVTMIDCENNGVYLNTTTPRCRTLFTLDI
jgi:prepilin-type N-terminal cleavage/methylation domain-containing protein